MNNNSFEEQYRLNTPKSRAMFERASRVLPGGVAGNGKFQPPYPIYVVGAQGADLVDVDSNKYVDLLMGGGVHILGHSSAPVLRAVREQLELGTQYYLPAEAEVRLAEKVCQLMPSVEMVRFLNTGSESTLMAMRAARAYRRRDKIAKFEGNFHGQHELGLVSTLGTAGQANAPEGHLDSAGVPLSTLDDVLVLPYNDVDHAASLIEQHADELATVILEPISAFGLGVVPAEPDFLQAMRAVTRAHDIPLIFDEVVTNFRLGLGGASEYFGIQPDLVCLGKILGGGFAIGGFGGRRDIMDKVVTPRTGLWDLSTQIFQSGCFSGNPVSMAAGLAVLTELEKGDIHPYIDHLADLMQQGLMALGQECGLPLLVNRVASIVQVHIGGGRIRNKRDAMAVDRRATQLFHFGLRTNGIMASAHPLFFSAAHTEEHIRRILAAAEVVLEQMQPVAMSATH